MGRRSLLFEYESQVVVLKLFGLVMPIWRSNETARNADQTLGSVTVAVPLVLEQKPGIGVAKCGKRKKQLVMSQDVEKNNHK
jgi:hypothetical protein